MIDFLRQCFPYFLCAGFFSLFINTLQLTFSLYMLAVYDGVLASSSLPTLQILTFLALAALTVWGCLEYCRSRLLIQAGIKLDSLLSRFVLKEMLLDLSRIDTLHYRVGLKDLNTLRNFLGGNSIFAFFDVPWIFIYLGIIYLVHPLLGLTATCGALIVLVLGLLQGKLTRGDLEQAQEVNNEGIHWFFSSARAAKEIQCMGMVGAASQKFCRLNDQGLSLWNKTGITNNVFGSISQGFGILMQVIIYGVGASLVIINEANPGVIIAASIIMSQALAPIRLGIGAWKQIADAKSAYNNLNRLLSLSRRNATLPVKKVDGNLHVENVSLYIEAAAILHKIDFQLAPGEIMGLIGPNGAGKTSLCRLILGIWQPTSGRVQLDDQEIFRLDKDNLGQYIGYLPQNVELFAGSVAENIARMGSVSAEHVVKAAQKAGAHEAILQFPHGYETDIGEAGLSLSGGQRQRVGLARALYGDPKLVILDEPNSNLDEAGEQALMETLQRLKSMGTTTIMITHKPSLLSVADKILMLRNGEQVMFGSRDEVLGQMTGVRACKNS